jgi:IS605 OrfB family transposase
MAYFQSKNNDRTYQTKRMKSMRIKHSNYVKDYINKASMELINLLRLSNVKKVIVGYNKGLKKEGIHNSLLTNKQKAKVNQSFVRIPLLKFKNRIKYLCEKYNLIYEEVNESYTSIKSFYDNDELNKESLTSGKRIKRGLYETKDKRIINADVNGALNIYKKSKPINDKSVLSLMDRGLTVPFRVKVFM